MVGYIGASVVGLSTVSADIDGTVTADGLTVEDSGNNYVRINSTDSNTRLYLDRGSVSSRSQIIMQTSGAETGGSWAMGLWDDETFRIEDWTGTDTTRLIIDTSGQVGIGTSSPTTKLQSKGGSISTPTDNAGFIANASASFVVDHANDYGLYTGYVASANDAIGIAATRTLGSTLPLILQPFGGNLGISTNDPKARLEVEDNGSTTGVILKVTADDSSPYALVVGNDTFSTTDTDGMAIWMGNSGEGTIDSRGTGALMRFRTNGTERMRIDSSGRLLIGHTTANGYALDVAKANLGAAGFNRTGSDGEIVALMKDGTTVGSIGYISTGLIIDGEANHSGWRFGNGGIAPIRNGADTDNTTDVGTAAARLDDVHATNGTIQTSDEREKQQIASLTDAEITAAKAISKLFKTFKWNDKVEEKGDAARTHTGVIAQQVETAMSDAGLDAGNYAFFISTTWWETQTEVAAVEAVEAQDAVYEDVVIPAVEEVLDEDGNVVTEAQPERTEQRLVSEAVEAVEAQEAYTRTDTYNTQEEAPEGATERNRKGIRYPELLSFIGAATEQRLTSIEARLDALEAN